MDDRPLAHADRLTDNPADQSWNDRKAFDRNLAVVIGIDRYSHSGICNLTTAVSDASAIADLLEQKYAYQGVYPSGRVLRWFDEAATLQGLRQLFNQILPEQLKPTAGDRLILYFAGHGLPRSNDDGPEGYLVPYDADPAEQRSFLAMREVSDALSRLACHHLLVILDCCFAGAFRWASRRKAVPILETIHREHYYHFIRHPAWQAITSTAHDQEALDIARLKEDNRHAVTGLAQPHSPFALALLEGLQPGDNPQRVQADLFPDGVVTAHELFVYLQARVKALSGEQQAPGIYPLRRDYDKGEFVFTSPEFDLGQLQPAPPLDAEHNPYRGLKSFEERHAKLFFGRQALIDELAQRLDCFDRPLTVLLGVSGSGKSSLVRAGLIPHLRAQQSHAGQLRWQILEPFRPGRSPFMALSKTLLPTEDEALLAQISRSLQQDPEHLSRAIGHWSEHYPGRQLLLVIDQLEELLTSGPDPAQDAAQPEPDMGEWHSFLEILKIAITDHPQVLRLVLTLRSDFEPRFLHSPLASNWQTARFPVRAMNSDELREVIENPAAEQALYFEDLKDAQGNMSGDLVSQLIEDVSQMPGALPLLSFTLSELYIKLHQRWRQNRNTDRMLCYADYQALGGVAGSLTYRATEEYESLDQQEQATLRRVLLRMVAIEGGGIARRQVPKSELNYADAAENQRVNRVIQRFSAARLIVEGNLQGEPYVEPAHDALVQGWDKLQIWKRQEEENLILQRMLTPAAEKWKSVKQVESSPTFAMQAVNGLDRSFNGIETGVQQLLQGLVRQRSSHHTQNTTEKSTPFLWHANPYLEIVHRVANSHQNWFNQTEAEFVQQSMLQKRRNISWRWRIAFGVILGLSGLTIAALVGQRNALIGQIRASQQAAEANFALNQQLNALMNSLEAGKNLQDWPWYLSWAKPNDALHAQVIETLRTVVYGTKERHILESNSENPTQRFFEADLNNGQVMISGQVLGRCGVNQPQLRNAIESLQLDPLLQERIFQGLETLEISGIQQLLVSPDRQSVLLIYYLDCEGSVTAHLWNLFEQSSKDVYAYGLPLVNSAMFSRNNLLATGDTQGKISVLGPTDPSRGDRPTIAFQGHQGAINQIFFSADDKQLETVGEDGVARLWNWQSKSLSILEAQISERVQQLKFSPDRSQLATLGADGIVDLWSYQSAQLKLVKSLPNPAVNFNFAPQGQLITIGTDGVLRLHQAQGDRLQESQPASNTAVSAVVNASLSPDRQTLAIVEQTSQGGETLTLADWNRQPIAPLQAVSDGSSAAEFKDSKVVFSPNGQQFAIRSRANSGKILWFDLAGNLLGEYEGLDLIFVGQQLLIAYRDGINDVIRIVNLGGRWAAQELKALDTGAVETGSFNQDGMLLAIADRTGKVQLWDWDRQTLLGQFQHPGQAISFSFSQDSSLLATVGEDGTARLWRIGALDDLLEMGCGWAREYLATLETSNGDRSVCDNIP